MSNSDNTENFQSFSSARESSDYESISYKRDFEYPLGALESSKKRMRDNDSQPLSSQAALAEKNQHSNSNAEIQSFVYSTTSNNAVDSSFQENCSNIRRTNSVTLCASNSSRTAPFDMTLTSEPSKIEKPSSYYFMPLQEAQYSSLGFPPTMRNTEQIDTANSSKVGNLPPVEAISQSPLFSERPWNDLRHITFPHQLSGHSQQGTQDTYTSNLSNPQPAHFIGYQFGNSMQTHAYPVILQCPFPYVSPFTPQATSQYRGNMECAPIIPENTIHNSPHNVSGVDCTFHSIEEKKAECWKQEAFLESRPVISMVSNESMKTSGSQQVILETNEEKFAAVASPFLRKLLSIIEDMDTQHLCSWTKSGRSFVVWHPIRFENEVLPRYYKHSNFSSFVRQLNQYGFHKLHPEAWEFGHPLFVRNRIDLIVRICRRPSRRLKKQSDVPRSESRREEPHEESTSRQHRENENILDSDFSPILSLRDNEEGTLEAVEPLDNTEWSQEEYREDTKDAEATNKNSSDPMNPSSATNQFHQCSFQEESILEEKPVERIEYPTHDINIPNVVGLIESICAKMNVIQEEVNQMQREIESLQSILKTLLPRSEIVPLKSQDYDNKVS